VESSRGGRTGLRRSVLVWPFCPKPLLAPFHWISLLHLSILAYPHSCVASFWYCVLAGIEIKTVFRAMGNDTRNIVIRVIRDAVQCFSAFTIERLWEFLISFGYGWTVAHAMQRSGQGKLQVALLACGGWVTGPCSTSNTFLHAERMLATILGVVPSAVHFHCLLHLPPALSIWNPPMAPGLRWNKGSLPRIGAGGSCASLSGGLCLPSAHFVSGAVLSLKCI